MDDPAQLSEYGKILLIAIVGLLLTVVTILLAKFLSPKKPNPGKLSTYECGEETTGSAWIQINPRFYVIALVFLLFDVELIFVFPWATVFGNTVLNTEDARWGLFTLIEMGIFLGILIVGLIYVWKRGDISWIKPTSKSPEVLVGIPNSAYDILNEKTYIIRDYRESTIVLDNVIEEQKVVVSNTGFKSKFKKTNS